MLNYFNKCPVCDSDLFPNQEFSKTFICKSEKFMDKTHFFDMNLTPGREYEYIKFPEVDFTFNRCLLEITGDLVLKVTNGKNKAIRFKSNVNLLYKDIDSFEKLEDFITNYLIMS